MTDDIVERLKSWDRCYPGNINIEDAVDEAANEINRLRRYEQLVQYIANDYWELSYDKIRWLYTEYKTKCRELIKEDNSE